MVYGKWYMVYDIWYMVYGLWCIILYHHACYHFMQSISVTDPILGLNTHLCRHVVAFTTSLNDKALKIWPFLSEKIAIIPQGFNFVIVFVFN